MPTPPSLTEVTDYLGADNSSAPGDIADAYATELAAQKWACRFPPDPELPAEPLPYPDDLAGALKRRVAHNLALRALPLGVQATISEMAVATTSVGGTDAEVRRLERPHRKLVLG